MRKPIIAFTLGLVLVILPQFAFSESRYIKTVEGEFEDVFFDLKDAVINRGLVIENIGHVGKMLERTAKAVTGSTALQPPLKVLLPADKNLLICMPSICSFALQN